MGEFGGLLLIFGGLGVLALAVYSWFWMISGAFQSGKVVIAEVRESIADERARQIDGEEEFGKNRKQAGDFCSDEIRAEPLEREIANHLLADADFSNTVGSVANALLSNAWKLGLPQPPGANPWAGVSIAYHFEESLIVRALYTEAEFLTSVVTIILEQLEARGAGRGLQTSKVFEALSLIALPMARERSRLAGSRGVLSDNEASEIHNARMQEYSTLIRGSVSCEEPLPIRSFMLGFPRNHPTGALIGSYADRLCAALDLSEVEQGLANILLQIAVAQKRNEILRKCIPAQAIG